MTRDIDPNADEYSAIVGGLIVAAGQVDLALDPSEVAERRAYVEKLAKRLIALDHVGTVVELALFSGRMLNRDARRQQLDPSAELEKIEAQMLLDDDGDAAS